jgi:hypothetical protein
MGKYCICATVDTGLVNKVVTLETATNKISAGWHILRDTITEDKVEAEKHLKRWKRNHRKLTKQLEALIY